MIPEWHDAAACKPHPKEWWFPEGGGDNIYAKARPICRTCPVQGACLAHALNQPEKFGMWGGLSEHQRRPLRQAHNYTMTVRNPAQCGTHTGYKAHLNRNETACDACKEANSRYVQEWKKRRRMLRVIDGGSGEVA